MCLERLRILVYLLYKGFFFFYKGRLNMCAWSACASSYIYYIEFFAFFNKGLLNMCAWSACASRRACAISRTSPCLTQIQRRKKSVKKSQKKSQLMKLDDDA